MNSLWLFFACMYILFSHFSYSQSSPPSVILRCNDIPLSGIDSIVVTKSSAAENYIVTQNTTQGRSYSKEVALKDYASGIIELAENWNGYALTLEFRSHSTWVLHYEDECQRNSATLYCTHGLM